MAEQKKKWRSKFFVRGLAVLFGLVLLIGSVVSSSIETRAASWVLRTITGTPGDAYPDHWGENGYSLVTHNGKSYLYIYGEHYRTDSSANPTVFKLHRWKWNDSSGDFQRYDVLTNSIYNNNPKRFFGFSSLNEWETGVYLFSHEAKVSGVTHEGKISQKITYSNWVTIGNGVNAKIALVYYDSINGESKIRIRNAQARNKIQSISVDTTNGIVMDIRGAMVSTDNGYDVRQFEGGRLVKHADGEYHVVGDDDPAKTGSEISVKNPSGSVIYSTSSGSEYSLGSQEQPYRYGKRDMTIPVSTLKSMTTNGTYSIVYSINVDSGSYGTKSIASTNLNAPSTGYSKTIKLLANDGAYHNYRVFESGGALKIQVTDATPPTASTEQTPTAWTNGGVTLRVYNISDTGGSGYDYVVLPNGSKSTKTDVSYTVNTNGSYTFTIYDRQGNTTTKTFTVSNIDKTNPTVTFGTNGNSTYEKSHSTTVSVSDSQSGVASRKYAWSTSSSTPPTNWTDFSNGATITTPGGVTGTYYLWVQATDNAGNTNTVRSNAFMLDNTTGTVTASPTSGGWTTEPYQVTLSYSDTPSGVKLRQYQWSTSTATPSSWQNYSSTITQPGTGTYYLHYRLEDQAGNVKTGYFGPYQYETTKPTADISYSPTGWTNGNVTITLNNISDSGGSGYDYTRKPDGTTTSATSFTYMVSQNGTYSFTIYDKAGNSTVKSVTISNIDKAAPTVTFGTNGNSTWKTSHSTTVTVSDSGGSGVKSAQYAWSDSSATAPTSGWTSFSSGGTITTPSSTGTHYLWVQAADNAGNTITVHSNGFNVDLTAPSVSANKSSGNWQNSPHQVTLTFSDGHSGVNLKQYQWSTSTTTPSSGWSNYTGPVTQPEEGTYYLHYKVTDNAGNTKTGYFGPYRYDKTAPTVSADKSSGDWQNSPHQVILTFTDSYSGVNTKQYAWSTSTSTPSSWSTYSGAVTQPGTGTYYLHYKVTDNAGNTKTGYFGPYRYETTKPTVTANKTSGDWQNSPHQVTLTYSDGQSGVKTKEYAWSTSTSTPSSWNTYSGTVTQPGTGIYYLHYRVVDEAGNEDKGYFGPYRYETTSPTASISYNPTGWTNGNVTITLNNISDSGGSGYDYTRKPDGTTTSETSFTYTVSQNGTYSFTVYDKAGNSTVKSVTISNIDKAAPTFGTSYSPTGWTNGNVTIVLKNINDTGGSGYDKTRLPDGTYTTNTNVSYTVSDNGSYQFTVYDKAGNSTTKTVIISNIDKVKPTAIVSYSTTLPTNGNVVVTVKAEDDRSGVESILLPDGTLVVGDQVSYTVSANGTYDFVVTDKAGNQTVVKAVVSNIDKTPPTLTLTANPTAWTNKPIRITASASDAGGIDRIVLPDGTVVRQTTASITVTQNGTYTFEAYDKVGNRTVKSITINNYDGDRPSVNIKETGRSGSKIDVQLEYGD